MSSIRLILIGIAFILFGISLYPLAFFTKASSAVIVGLIFSILGLILVLYSSCKKLD